MTCTSTPKRNMRPSVWLRNERQDIRKSNVSNMSFSMLILETHEQHIKFKSKPEANIEFSGVPVTRVARAAPSAPKHTMV